MRIKCFSHTSMYNCSSFIYAEKNFQVIWILLGKLTTFKDWTAALYWLCIIGILEAGHPTMHMCADWRVLFVFILPRTPFNNPIPLTFRIMSKGHRYTDAVKFYFMGHHSITAKAPTVSSTVSKSPETKYTLPDMCEISQLQRYSSLFGKKQQT